MKICFYGSYDRNFTSNMLVKRGLEENGIDVIEVNAHVPITRLDKKADMGFLPLIKRVTKKFRLLPLTFAHLKDIASCDFIYVGYPGHFDVFPAYILKKIFGKKLVFNPLIIFYTGFVEEQGILNPRSPLAWILKWCEGRMYSMCDIVLADTLFRKKQLRSLFDLPESKLHILPIGADDSVYRFAKKKKDGFFNAVYYGLFSPVHGVEYIIEAATLLRNNKKIKFHLVGNGNRFDEIKEMVEKSSLENVVLYPDVIEKNALPILQQADVFFGFLADHPVIHQAVPNKAYQGIALGKTVISADGLATKSQFIDKKDMYFVKPANAVQVADAISFLAKNDTVQQEISANAYRRYITEFTPRMVGKTLKNILELEVGGI